MIDIRMYSSPKDQGVTTQSKVILQGDGGGVFEPHYIWGQYFDDTKDINGDMKVNGTAYIDYSYMIELNAQRINATYTNTAYLGADYGEINFLKSRQIDADYAAILKAFIGEMSATSITTENLTVTKSAHFFQLVIDQIKAAGGAVLFTPANGFTVRKYDKIEGGWRLYFLANERGSAIRNMWQINDQAICQSFNNVNAGVNYDISNKYYWSVVINTNNDDNGGNPVNINVGTGENIDMQWCHYIDISDTVFDGNIDISVDDEIAMLGYRGEDDEARQNAIYISCYSSLDTEIKAPLICQYKGINDFNLAKHKYTWFSGGVTPEGIANGRDANEIRGSIKMQDGKTIEDAFGYMYSYIGEFRVSADEISSKVGYISSYIDSLTGEVKEKVSWSYIMQHADEINLNVIDGLKETGIDIKTGEIIINADNTTFLGNISMKQQGDGITLYDENNKPKVIISRDRLERKYISGGNYYEYLPSELAQTKTRRINTKDYLVLGDYWTETKAQYKSRYYNDIKRIFLGNYTTSDTFYISLEAYLRFAAKEYDKGIYDIPSLWNTDKGVYKITYKVFTGSGNTVISSTTVTIQDKREVELQIQCNYNDDYYLDWTIDYVYDTDKVVDGMTYLTITEALYVKITESAAGMTFIGLNGIYSSQNSERQMIYSYDGFNIKEKEPKEFIIGNDNNHKILNPKYELGVDPNIGPYINYADDKFNTNLSPSWRVGIGTPVFIEVSNYDFYDTKILDENGNEITVKGINLNTNIYSIIYITGYFNDSNDYYIILPRHVGGMVMIYNYSLDKNIFIYARNESYSKNIYINQRRTYSSGSYHNTGRWRYEFGQTDEMLWMAGDLYGWHNVSLIDH